MPCRVEESPDEVAARLSAEKDKFIAEAIEPWMERANELTHENDMLRETLLALQPYQLVTVLDEIIQRVDDENWSNIYAEERSQIVGAFETWLEDNLQGVTKETWDKIQADQVEHRKEDLRRLQLTFKDMWMKIADMESDAANVIWEKWDRVRKADPQKPLQPQLGFDPDDF